MMVFSRLAQERVVDGLLLRLLDALPARKPREGR
jgi:hypothetical protein